ncbi:MAG: 30S ribosomal protein S1 [Rhodospirillaceae bacterium]|jgi:small subunit ribosomal protein S1|nr:30S ribosomal protein S1 [Rhodospirillaceae bacterium]MBT5458368.1 30S ribosomal protein S1 [Rhodospirillaceae bacterium]
MAIETATSGDDAMASDENFIAMLEETFGEGELSEGSVVKGTVIAIEGDSVLIDVGLKSEGRVGLKEFTSAAGEAAISVGEIIDVYLERMEDRNGEAVLSREKARREEAWTMLEKAFQDAERVTGSIFGRVKGGFTVDLSGAVAFLPGSQVDVRPVRDISPLMGTPQPFQILKMDRRRGNIVVSRRAVLEESRAEQRAELLAGLQEGQVVDGIVKNLTDYGAFVDLGGVDGLLHVTDIAWRRINHPSEVLSVGQSVKVQIIRFNAETQRISLGMKQLEADPWDGVESKYPVGARYTGRVSNITDYGAFVELEPGVEGLVHVSEMSWTKKNVHPGKIISTSQEVEVMVLDVDSTKRRISLGIKQTEENPWTDFAGNHPVGTELEGEIKNITEFGLFVGLPGEIDGMVHLSDLSWDKSGEEAIKDYKKGDAVKARVLDIDIEKERISLGVKQLTDDPFESASEGLKKGEVVTCTVAKVMETGLEVTVAGSVPGFIRRGDLARERSEQRPDRFAEGDRIDAVITNIDRRDHRLTLSVKAQEIKEEKQAMAEFGSSDSGASLGDILGAAMKRAENESASSLSDDALSDEPAADEPDADEPAADEPDAEEAGGSDAEEGAEEKKDS